jgi:pimeloyl-ACP methyl ester carboxylesterase
MKFENGRFARRVAATVCLLFAANSAGVAQGSLKIIVPDPVPDVAHGTLINSTISSKAGPAGSKQYQLLYSSRSTEGAPIAVSGFAFIPAGTPPSDGWPVLSYAHGTVGIADKCAPSQKIGLVEQAIATLFNAQGIAVVATDYEGLGTPNRHPYLVGESEGRGVLDIVSAARQIPGESLSATTLIWGHSQGGHAALFGGQLAKSWSPDLRVVGVVAGAPPSQLNNVADSLTNSKYRGYLFMVTAGLQSATPSLNIDDVLTEKGKSLLPIVDTGCNNAVFSTFNRDPLDTLIKRESFKTGPWADALARNEPGTIRIDAPVLIVHGTADEQIPVATSAKLLSRMCANGTTVQRKTFKGQDHGGTALASIGDVVAFGIARLAGIPAPTSCRK